MAPGLLRKAMRVRQGLGLVKEAFGSWVGDHAQSMGAALAYYAMFSIAPLLLIVISVAGLIFGEEAVRGALFAQLSDLVGSTGVGAIEEMLNHASRPTTGSLTTVISALLLLVGASTVFGQLQSSLDLVWRVPAKNKESGLWKFLKARFLSFGMVLGLAFLVTVSLVLSAALSALGKWWGPAFAGWETLAHAADLAVNFALLTVIFALIYKLMPRARIQWRDVWVGAGFTSALFAVGKLLIGLYLGKSDVGSAFGAFGALVIVMVWVYYSAQIFLLGAEFTWVFAHTFGSRRGQKRPPSLEDMAMATTSEPGTGAPATLRELPEMAQPKPAYAVADQPSVLRTESAPPVADAAPDGPESVRIVPPQPVARAGKFTLGSWLAGHALDIALAGVVVLGAVLRATNGNGRQSSPARSWRPRGRPLLRRMRLR